MIHSKCFSPRLVMRLAFALHASFFLAVPAFSQTTPKPEAEVPVLTVNNLFTLPPAADCGDNNTNTPLWSGGGKVFAIWRDATMHPMVTEIPEGGTGDSVPLDPNPKYMAQYREYHHSYSLGLDKNGYIHITGDMCNYPGENDKFQPPRYRKKIILYWRSKSPYTVKDGFEFVGGDPARAIPGTKWSDGAFYADNNGELYYMSRVLAVGGAHTPPEMGIGLYRYDAAKGSWSALGAEPAHIYGNAEYHPVLFWGLPSSTEINREARGTIRFDKQNRMHFSAPAALTADTVGMNALLYACSEDGGKTWKKAGGNPITVLPLRAVPGPSQADVVASFNLNGALAEFYTSNDLSGTASSVHIVQRMSPPPGGINSARWTGEIVFPEAGVHTIEFAVKECDALMFVINKQRGGQDPESGRLKPGFSQKYEAEKGMTMGFSIVWQNTPKYPGSFTPKMRWQLAGHPAGEIPVTNLLPGRTRFDSFSEVAVDDKGTPMVACNPSNLYTGSWHYWDTTRKTWTGEIPYPGDSKQHFVWGRDGKPPGFGELPYISVSQPQNRILLGPDGMLTFESVSGFETYYVTPKVQLYRTSAFDKELKPYLLKDVFRIHGTDEFTLRKTGIYRTLLFDGPTQVWSVGQVELPPANK